MNTIEEKINNILTNWNPINVPDEIAYDEYKSHIPSIIKYSNSYNSLFECLVDIVKNKIGLEFDINNKEHLKDLNKVANEIYGVMKSHNN